MNTKKVKEPELVEVKPNDLSKYPIAKFAFRADGSIVFYREKVRLYVVRVWVDNNYIDPKWTTDRKEAFCFAKQIPDHDLYLIKSRRLSGKCRKLCDKPDIVVQILEYDDILSPLPQRIYQLNDEGSFRKVSKRVKDQELTNSKE